MDRVAAHGYSTRQPLFIESFFFGVDDQGLIDTDFSRPFSITAMRQYAVRSEYAVWWLPSTEKPVSTVTGMRGSAVFMDVNDPRSRYDPYLEPQFRTM